MHKTSLVVATLGCAFVMAAAHSAIIRGAGGARNDGGGGTLIVYVTSTTYPEPLRSQDQQWLIDPDYLPVPLSIEVGGVDEICATGELMFCEYSVGAGESRKLHVEAAVKSLLLADFPREPFQTLPDLTVIWRVRDSGGVLRTFEFAGQDASASEFEFDLVLNDIPAGTYTLEVEFAFSLPDDFAFYRNDGVIAGDIRDSSAQNFGQAYSILNRTFLHIDPNSVPAPDDVPPEVSVTGVEQDATYQLGSVPVAGCETTDDWSGVHTPATLSVTGGTANGVGNFTATCDGALDNAGNPGPAVSVTYAVRYAFQGFFSPVDNIPVVNRAKAGQSVPIKFSLAGDHGLDILGSGSPATQSMACGDGVIDAIEETASPGSSTLSYDSLTGYYQYVWKTPRSFAGTCRVLFLKLDDGGTYSAYFSFK